MKIQVRQQNGIIYAKARVKMINYSLNVYTYLLNGLLIDCGPSRFSRDFINFFQEHNINNVALTHFHEDHSGNAFWFSQQGIPVYIHKSVLNSCKKKAKLPIYRYIFWGKRESFLPQPISDRIEGENVTCKVIETPGHSPDHVALYSKEQGALFTGDLVVTPRPTVLLKGENVPQIIASLRCLLAYDFSTVYCAHAGPIRNGREVITKKIDYLETVTGKVLELHQQGWDILEIRKKMFPKTPMLSYISAKDWASEHIIESIIMHNQHYC